MALNGRLRGADGNWKWGQDGDVGSTRMYVPGKEGGPTDLGGGLPPTTDMAAARRRFEVAKAARSGALRTRAGLDGVMAGIAKKEHYASELENGADYESKRGRYGQTIIQAMRDQAKGLRNEAAGEKNAFDERWRTNRRDLARTQREMPRSGVSSTGVGYTTQKVNGVSTLVSDDNKAFIQARRATPDEIAAGRERDSARAASVVGTGGAVAGFDTGMAVGSKAAAEHGARLAAHRRSDSGGAAARLRGHYARQQQMANDFRGTAYWRNREQIEAPRRRDFLEAMKIQGDQRSADADRDFNRWKAGREFEEYGKDREAARAENAASREHDYKKASWERENAKKDQADAWAREDDVREKTWAHEAAEQKQAIEDARATEDAAVERMTASQRAAYERKLETFKKDWPAIFEQIVLRGPQNQTPGITKEEFDKLTGGDPELGLSYGTFLKELNNWYA